jgi:adenylate cyclase
VDQETADTFVRYDSDGETIEVPIERLRICGFGRALTNTVVLADTVASREHAMIRRNASGHCLLNDLGSTNGTWLNGRAVTTPTPLVSGDVITIGRHRFTFVQTSELVALENPHGRTQHLVEQQFISVLVADVRGYSSLAAQMGSERIADMMGDIFREAGDVLSKAQSWSTKYIGDAIMAFWIHPRAGLMRADLVNVFDVISAYQGIFRVAERKYKPPAALRFGCGYSAGTASIGNIGSAGAPDFTATGETVNTAFRLERATKELGCDLLVEKAVFDSLSDRRVELPDLLELDLKGYDHAVAALPLYFANMSDFLDTLLAG